MSAKIIGLGIRIAEVLNVIQIWQHLYERAMLRNMESH
jgi:hypothetical protein